MFKSTLEPVEKVLKDAKMAREKVCVKCDFIQAYPNFYQL